MDHSFTTSGIHNFQIGADKWVVTIPKNRCGKITVVKNTELIARMAKGGRYSKNQTAKSNLYETIQSNKYHVFA